MKHPVLLAVCIALPCAACASVSVSGIPNAPEQPRVPVHEHQDPAGIQGHWAGTYFQDNGHKAYPMQLTADGGSNGFAVTLDWPELWQSRTVGHGSIHADSVAWTEEQLVRGEHIVLGGRYEAALIDPDTIVGVYEHNNRRMGFFTLSRTHGEAKVTEIPPISVKVKLSG